MKGLNCPKFNSTTSTSGKTTMFEDDREPQPTKQRPYCHVWVNPKAPKETKAAHRQPKASYHERLQDILASSLWYQYRHLGNKAGRPTQEQMDEFAQQHTEAFAEVVNRFVGDRINTKFWFAK